MPDAREHAPRPYPRGIDPRGVVEQGYDAVAQEYRQLESPVAEWPRLRRLEELLDRLAPGSLVLDAGCGCGVPAAARIARDHRVVGVDISSRQIELARANVPEGEFFHGDVSRVELPAAGFDAIVAFYAVEHLPREEHAALFARFRGWLRDGGLLLFTVESEEEPGRVGEWLGVPMYMSQYGPETTLWLVCEAGFEVLSAEVESQLEGDREVEYLWVLARVRS